MMKDREMKKMMLKEKMKGKAGAGGMKKYGGKKMAKMAAKGRLRSRMAG